jgi:hypothetical protein
MTLCITIKCETCDNTFKHYTEKGKKYFPTQCVNCIQDALSKDPHYAVTLAKPDHFHE